MMDVTEFASLASLALLKAQIVVETSRRVTKSDRQAHRRALLGEACGAMKLCEEFYKKLNAQSSGLVPFRDVRYAYALRAALHARDFARVELKLATQFTFQKEIER